jgi:GTPase Era involved in 16S rRNA processing
VGGPGVAQEDLNHKPIIVGTDTSSPKMIRLRYRRGIEAVGWVAIEMHLLMEVRQARP